jgi:hypothetical protein
MIGPHTEPPRFRRFTTRSTTIGVHKVVAVATSPRSVPTVNFARCGPKNDINSLKGRAGGASPPIGAATYIDVVSM